MPIKEAKAYITCPVSHSQEKLHLLPQIQATVESSGIKTFVFEIGGSPEEIFERDYQQLASSTLIIAEVSETSHGVGIEIGLSYPLGLKRILLIQSGNTITKLAQGIPETIIIEYENPADMLEKLTRELSNPKYH
jgi:hypothetical protein